MTLAGCVVVVVAAALLRWRHTRRRRQADPCGVGHVSALWLDDFHHR